MTIRILYFATFREQVGRDEESRRLPEATSVSQLWARLSEEVPFFRRFPAMPPAAVNREYVRGERTLEEGDEVAFLPPVAGG